MEKANTYHIHISAHPTDRYLFFERLYGMLSAIEGCRVSYTEAPKDGRQDLPDEVDMLVVIATEHYFTWQNSGYESEYLSAKSRGIRTIPLMLESHIVDLVNMRCSKSQYIDASEDFEFALAALEAHIKNPLPREVDDSLPSVFISYRRQEKKALRQLVEIIEKAPNYNAFTLWYDELISPGDNYSHAIMKALKESDFFILLVTPSLLEEGNYVMRAEYPTAKKMNKMILAIEALKTDREELFHKYPDLRSCVSIRQPDALYAKLLGIRDKP
ncbi:MAG: toll/interleukin-1 receptor domain-containing protein [Clostridia bacterium]|nr:toll/interleukin-1 receptor domain-containing protein [Clostridia bacterium]